MFGMATVAGVLALLERMIEHPTWTDRVTAVTGSDIAAGRVARWSLCGVAGQASARGHSDVTVSGG